MRRRLRRRPAPRKVLTPKSTIWKAPGSDDSGALRLVLLPHGSAWFCVLPLGKVGIVLVPTGDPPSLRFGHPDVTTDDTAFPHWDTMRARPRFPDAPSGCQPGRSPMRSEEGRSVRVTGAPA